MRGIFFVMHIDILKTDATNPHFQNLVRELDYYLAEMDGEDHSFYAKYNKLDDLKNCIILFCDGVAVSCGAYKIFNDEPIEIKRMFTKEEYRGKGFAKMVILFLEKWSREKGFSSAVLETGKKQESAVKLYQSQGYEITPNYGQYIGIEDSICFAKHLKSKS